MIMSMTGTDPLGDRLALLSLEAEALADVNIKVTTPSKCKFPKGTDKEVKKMALYYRFHRSSRRVPTDFDAYREDEHLYVYGGGDKDSVRWAVEALMLGGSDDAGIEGLCGVSKRAVALYRKFYFDIASPGNRQLLELRCSSMMSRYDDRSTSRWGYKIEVLVHGTDYFIRNRLKLSPTDDDKERNKVLVERRIDLARLDASLLSGNMANYGNERFLEMQERTGATYKYVQNDALVGLKAKAAGAIKGMGDLLDKYMEDAATALGMDLKDRRESSSGDEKSAVEAIL